MKCPEDKALGYTAVVVVCAIVLSVIVTSIGGVIAGAGMIGAGALGGGALGGTTARRSNGEIQFDKNSPMGKLQEFGKKLEESNKKMEAAQKSGDQNVTAAAEEEVRSTQHGGGKSEDEVGVQQRTGFGRESAGLAKTSSSGKRDRRLDGCPKAKEYETAPARR
jgi:hypothetical protein